MIFLFFILWMIFSGTFTVENIIFGVLIVSVMMWFTCKYLNYKPRYEKMLFQDARIVRLAGILVAEIVKANLQVVKWVYSSDVPNPCVVQFRTRLKNTLTRVALADCITLTPGTITSSLEDDLYIVHCLDESMAEGLDQSIFVRELMNLEGEEK